MITLIEALNFRCLRYVHQPLKPFHVLVGPNASGKTTFLDVVALLGRLVSDGLDAALDERSPNLHDLVWQRQGDRFELAIEAQIPDERRSLLSEKRFDRVRYEVAVGIDATSGERAILGETVLLKVSSPERPRQRLLFPELSRMPSTILKVAKGGGKRTVINKVSGGNDNFYSEVYGESGKGWAPAFKLGPRKSALGNLPEDESKFPVSTWLKRLLADGVQRLVLNSLRIRNASPPHRTRQFEPDGSNIPWVIESLLKSDPERFRWLLDHIRTALPDIEGIRTIERQDDKHRYLVIEYSGGLEVPSWMASDGTLRLLALTLAAYVPDFRGVYLVEEPENGIHPLAVETVFQSLSSVYEAQLLLATHSAVILSIAQADQVLCFGKTEEGATDIVLGSEHPALTAWRGETNLGTLFASGVLG
jgi:predicted ATPase